MQEVFSVWTRPPPPPPAAAQMQLLLYEVWASAHHILPLAPAHIQAALQGHMLKPHRGALSSHCQALPRHCSCAAPAPALPSSAQPGAKAAVCGWCCTAACLVLFSPLLRELCNCREAGCNIGCAASVWQ